MNEDSATLETKEDAGKGQEGTVKRWLMDLSLADKTEEKWRKTAQQVVDRFRQEGDDYDTFKKGQSKFNILWSNTEVMRPALYHSTPKPDVRRRFRDEDPVGKTASQVLERGLSFSIDSYDFDQVMTLSVLDLLLPGRGVSRVRYEPTLQTVTPPPEMPQPMGQNPDGSPIYAPEHMDETGQPVMQQPEPFDKITYQAVSCEHVAWKDFRRGPGRTWDEVEWISFDHRLTKDQITELADAELAGKVTYDLSDDDEDEKKDDDEGEELFKRALVREVWDKTERKVIFIAPSLKDKPLKETEDSLKLQGFFPIPRPMYALETSDSLIPVELFKLYKDQADELDRITQRINKLIGALKARGLYDPTIGNLEEVSKADDNEMVPAKDSAIAVFAQGGSFDKAIWMWPLDKLITVLKELYIDREQVKATIYEITGLSDILRGDSDPNETLGAQQIKAQSGSRRLRRMQKEVQRYARDLMRLKAEIMSEHFEPFMFQLMAGDKVQVDDKVMAVLRSDMARSYKIDIETDSTIAEDEQQDQKAVTDLLDGITRFVAGVGPVVQAGYMSVNAAMAMLKAIVRRFKFGREVEDALEDAQAQLEEQSKQPKQPSPEEQAAQAEMQAKQQQMMMDQQAHQADLEAKAKAAQLAEQAAQAEEVRKQHAFEREQARLDQATVAANDRAQYELNAKIDMMRKTTDAQVEAARAKAKAQPKDKKAAA
jgi:hypothetical protein